MYTADERRARAAEALADAARIDQSTTICERQARGLSGARYWEAHENSRQARLFIAELREEAAGLPAQAAELDKR